MKNYTKIIIIILYILTIFWLKTVLTQRQEISYIRKIEKIPFLPQEKLNFVVKWGIIIGGYSSLKVSNGNWQGHKIICIRSEAKSTPFFDHFYKVRDVSESYVETQQFYSLRFYKNLNEGKYHKEEEIIFDQENHKAFSKDKVIEIVPFTQDILSSLFYLRTQELKINETIVIPVSNNEKNYELVVKILKKDKIKVPAGKFNTILVEPLLKYEGIFQHRGRLLVWLTDDEKKIPVLMRSKIAVGAIDAELLSIESGQAK